MPLNESFSEDERNTVCRLLGEGRSTAEIAAMFDRPRNSVTRLAKKLGIPVVRSRNLWSDWEAERAHTLYSEGKSYTQISIALGRSFRAVKGYLLAHRDISKPLAPKPMPPPRAGADIYTLWCLKMAGIRAQTPASPRPEAAS